MSLQELLVRPGFFDTCQHWCSSETSANKLSDLYSGNIWKDFQYFVGKPFLALSTRIGLIINIDCFQPFSHTVFSVGVVYLVVMNLPRYIRYKRENVIIIGIIPGPSEPSHGCFNNYLEPLVKELKDLWTGVSMPVCVGTTTLVKTIQCAVLCCACDLPTGRKVCGFLGHSVT